MKRITKKAEAKKQKDLKRIIIAGVLFAVFIIIGIGLWILSSPPTQDSSQGVYVAKADVVNTSSNSTNGNETSTDFLSSSSGIFGIPYFTIFIAITMYFAYRIFFKHSHIF